MSHGKLKLAAAALAILGSASAFGSAVVDVKSCSAEGPTGTLDFVDSSTESRGSVDITMFRQDVAGCVFGAVSDGDVNLQIGDLIVGTLRYELLVDEDPYIQYALAVSNFSSSTVTYTFTFLSAYAGGPYNTMTSTHSSTVTDGGTSPSGGVTVTPVSATVAIPSLNMVDVAALGLGDGCTTGTGSNSCDASGVVSTAVAAPASGLFGVRVAFGLSGNDLLAATGRVELLNTSTPVPAPGGLALLGAALAGVGLLRRRAA